MDFIKKYKFLLLLAFGISILYIFTRLYNILELPIFTDEAIYVRWAQIAKNDAYWRFISLTDGKQPLFVWVAMILMKVVAALKMGPRYRYFSKCGERNLATLGLKILG